MLNNDPRMTRDPRSEAVHREFNGWMEANSLYPEPRLEAMLFEAFEAGFQAAEDLKFTY